jgi:photosystem II stability/assembly factor-like uncharacterized protein
VLSVVALVLGALAPGATSSANTSKPTTATADPLRVLRSTASGLGLSDPDLPPVGHEVDARTYLALRAQQDALYRGAPFTLPYNARAVAIQRFDRQVAHRTKTAPAWDPIGPAPIPNGQTTPVKPVSGRVTAIAVDPTDANVVYVGTAQGGVYRSKNGGTTWTPLTDNALSLAIGSLAIPPSDNTILYVGTGEGNLSGDSYAGVGLYRINSANGTTPVLHGPFESRVAGTGTSAGNGHAFNFLAIQGIAVDPANAARVYLSATPGGIGMGGTFVCCISPSADPGLYFTSTGTAATPTFSKVNDGLPQSSGSFLPASTDVKFLQGSSSTLLVGIEDIGFGTTTSNGIWQTITADQPTPTFTHIALPNAPFNTRIATSTAKVIVGAETNSGGRLFLSTDGGATFPTTVTSANGFCSQQCFYDMAPAIDPNSANNMLLGGSADGNGSFVLMRSTTATPSFSQSDAGLHADSHATAYAVTNPVGQHVVYAGNDGGIFKSTDGGATWSSLNNTGFSATQFESIAVHPTDPNFTIGGTQDNGTEFYHPNATWTRADFGDGGFARIDQTAANTSTVTMYHTYFNQTNNVIGFARVTSTANAQDNGWSFFGCGGTANGISCGDDPLFYAPLQLGAITSGHQNVYFGTNKLYRSVNQGTNMTAVSQTFAGGQTGKISAIGLTTADDNVRIVGLNGGGIFGTTTGSSTLDNLDNSGQIPNSYVARVDIDPTNSDVAYVTIGGFQGGIAASQSHVWKTTNINGTSTSWTGINTGLPDVPVNAMVIDPNDHTHLFVGTDIGVYASTDSGAHWAPFGTGLPIVAIFDMAIAQPGTGSEVLRVATHGRGMYEAAIGGGGGGATLTVSLSGGGGGTVTSDDGHINCPGSCSFSYTPGAVVHLTANHNGTSTFGQWTGCDSPAANVCTQTVNANESVDASFDSNDSTNPTASMTKPAASVTISKSIGLQWNANDTGGSGLANVDVRVKSAKFNAAFGSFTQPASLQHLTGTSKTFTGAAGTSYCFSVRARDNAGNLSAFSATKCTMIPVDDKTLVVKSGTWQRRTGQAGAFNGTLTIASAHNATLTLANLHARQVGIMVKRCSNCGTLLITFAGGQTFQADTSGSGFQIFTIPTTSTVKQGTLTLKVGSAGHPVQIDGVAAPQTGSITLSAPSGRIRPLG